MERISQWMGILANVGVLLGFLVIAYQLQLNRESMHQAANQQTSSLAVSAEVGLMGDSGYAAYAKSIVDPSDLSDDELVQFWTYMSIAQLNAQQSYIDFKEGRISEEAWFYARGTFVSYFNYPMGRVWFEETKRLSGNSNFYSSVQEALDQAEPDMTSKWFLTMRKRSKELPNLRAGT